MGTFNFTWVYDGSCGDIIEKLRVGAEIHVRCVLRSAGCGPARPVRRGRCRQATSLLCRRRCPHEIGALNAESFCDPVRDDGVACVVRQRGVLVSSTGVPGANDDDVVVLRVRSIHETTRGYGRRGIRRFQSRRDVVVGFAPSAPIR